MLILRLPIVRYVSYHRNNKFHLRECFFSTSSDLAHIFKSFKRTTEGEMYLEKLDKDVKLQTYFKRMSKKFIDLKNRPVEPDEFFNVMNFLQSVGMSEAVALGSIAKHPNVLVYRTESMLKRIEWMKKAGISPSQISNTLRRHPNMLGLDLENRLEQKKEWYIEQGVEPKRIPYLLTIFPQIASYTIGNLNMKIQFFASCGLDKSQIIRILQRTPQVMTLGIERMEACVNLLREEGYTEQQLGKIIAIAPEILCLSLDGIKSKIAAFKELLGKEFGQRILFSCPRLIMSNPDQVRRSFEFFQSELEWDLQRIQGAARQLGRGVDTILLPRYRFLQAMKEKQEKMQENGGVPLKKEHSVCNVSSMIRTQKWIILSDAQFQQFFPEYRQFLMTFKKETSNIN